MLLQAGYDVNYQNNNGCSSLHIAVENVCDTIIFDALLSAGADVNIINFAGFTALDLVEQSLDDIRKMPFNHYELTDRIVQLEKIKAILLQVKNQ